MKDNCLPTNAIDNSGTILMMCTKAHYTILKAEELKSIRRETWIGRWEFHVAELVTILDDVSGSLGVALEKYFNFNLAYQSEISM